MENTRENVVKLLQAMAENAHLVADFHKDDPEFASLMRTEAICREQAIWLLTDVKFFNSIWDSYIGKEGEN
jgi:hypothetical protein